MSICANCGEENPDSCPICNSYLLVSEIKLKRPVPDVFSGITLRIGSGIKLETVNEGVIVTKGDSLWLVPWTAILAAKLVK